MTGKIDATTVEDLGPEATDHELGLYKQAARKLVNELGMDEEAACEEAWAGGDFMSYAAEALDLDLT